MKKIFSGAWNGIANIVENVCNFMIDAVNWVIRQLNKIHIDVPDWVTDLTGMTGFGFNIPLLSNVQLPRLAKGAVIPANSEFLAVLGDQKNGRNLEAPENLIRQIVREETGSQTVTLQINADGNAKEFVRWLRFELSREDSRRGVRLVQGGAY